MWKGFWRESDYQNTWFSSSKRFTLVSSVHLIYILQRWTRLKFQKPDSQQQLQPCHVVRFERAKQNQLSYFKMMRKYILGTASLSMLFQWPSGSSDFLAQYCFGNRGCWGGCRSVLSWSRVLASAASEMAIVTTLYGTYIRSFLISLGFFQRDSTPVH